MANKVDLMHYTSSEDEMPLEEVEFGVLNAIHQSRNALTNGNGQQHGLTKTEDYIFGLVAAEFGSAPERYAQLPTRDQVNFAIDSLSEEGYIEKPNGHYMMTPKGFDQFAKVAVMLPEVIDLYSKSLEENPRIFSTRMFMDLRERSRHLALI